MKQPKISHLGNACKPSQVCSYVLACALLVPALAHGDSARTAQARGAAHSASAGGQPSTSSKRVHSSVGPNVSPNPISPNRSSSAQKHVSARASHQRAPIEYVQSVRGWHQPGPDLPKAPLDKHGRPMLVLYSVNSHDRAELTAATDEGGFSAQDLDRAAVVLRDTSSGNQHPVEPRTIDLLYRIQRHFNAPEIRVVSGYRTTTPYRANSYHGKGRAVDFIVPGSSDYKVAEFARQFGFVGVGVYPESGFVHLDSRPKSYFWRDSSAPGHHHREQAILGDVAYRADATARARGEQEARPPVIERDVDAVIETKKNASTITRVAEPTPAKK